MTKSLIVPFLVLSSALGAILAEIVGDYSNHQLISIINRPPSISNVTRFQWNVIKQFLEPRVDFWTDLEDDVVDFLVTPHYSREVVKFLVDNKIDFKILSNDIQQEINRQQNSDFLRKRSKRSDFMDILQIATHGIKDIFQSRPDPGQDRLLNILRDTRRVPKSSKSGRTRSKLLEEFPSMNWRSYQRLGTIYGFLYQTEAYNPNLVSIISIGRSVEGRDILVAKIGTPTNYIKPAIFIEAGIHAREWISPATATYIIAQLVDNYQFNRDILDFYDVYVMPSMNPDGYEYSHTHNRFWRKNRANTLGLGMILPLCSGVDLNRNFATGWGGGDVFKPVSGTSLMCLETYMGNKPFSEPESRAVRDFLISIKDSLVMYISLHSYGQKIIYPWSGSRKKIPDWSDLHSVGQIMQKKIMEASNGRYFYKVGTSPNINYLSYGGSDDWVRGKLGVKWVFLFELPDKKGGAIGFLLPADQILPTAHSIFHAIRSGALAIKGSIV